MSTARPLRLGLYVFDGADELDLIGPYTVLTRWAESAASRPDVVTFSDDGAGVRLAGGLLMVPDVAGGDTGPLHVLIYPGGPGAQARMSNSKHLSWVRDQRASVPLMVGVSTGALVLAAAGLLAGRPCTTHPGSIDLLATTEPSALVDTRARFVDDGDIITTAGSVAGLDAALRLVARLDSRAVADQTARALDYQPVPSW
ncbi:DJ-1/PfpI family protein [Sanguibacter gelidistatuariae]|uniref:DJ-1/PfpI family protein n=1 Tax=Sanguibacter gelidistatuariae TaxID=1814289 RepID=A0A1G6R9X0_9MICO|nr:DJ-1/PfpI family protein [Sanguibacter gelidistatuariae]SDD01328.1 DJ-1/PfpI family protein [Sanguibacter gelidistatuariae]